MLPSQTFPSVRSNAFRAARRSIARDVTEIAINVTVTRRCSSWSFYVGRVFTPFRYGVAPAIYIYRGGAEDDRPFRAQRHTHRPGISSRGGRSGPLAPVIFKTIYEKTKIKRIYTMVAKYARGLDRTQTPRRFRYRGRINNAFGAANARLHYSRIPKNA